MKKLTGTDIITLIKASSTNEEVLREAQSLNREDFNNDDLVVKTFFNSFPEGFASKKFSEADRTKVAATLANVKKEISNYALRKAHNLLQNIRCADNEAVQVENLFNEESPDTGFESQLKAAKLVLFLSKYIDGQKNKEILADTHKQINKGLIKEASENIHEVYSGSPKNLRMAFVTVKNQIGEGYQLCPKGIYIWGQARPMALSNCREYCVDARLRPDGNVACNYLKWLNDTLITQDQAVNLGDKIDYDKDGIEYMELEKGKRTHFPISDQDSLDMRVVREKEADIKPWEEKLEATRDKAEQNKAKNAKENKKVEPIASDTAIELLLKDKREPFDEDDLDNLEELIRKAVGE